MVARQNDVIRRETDTGVSQGVARDAQNCTSVAIEGWVAGFQGRVEIIYVIKLSNASLEGSRSIYIYIYIYFCTSRMHANTHACTHPSTQIHNRRQNIMCKYTFDTYTYRQTHNYKTDRQTDRQTHARGFANLSTNYHKCINICLKALRHFPPEHVISDVRWKAALERGEGHELTRAVG